MITVKHILIFILLSITSLIHGQETFLNFYNLGAPSEDSLGHFSGVIETDSGYLITGDNRAYGKYYNPVFLFVDLEGNVQEQLEFFDSMWHAVAFTTDNLIETDTSYVLHYRRENPYWNQGDDGFNHEKAILEFSRTTHEFKLWIDSSWTERKYSFIDFPRALFSRYNSAIYTFNDFFYSEYDSITNEIKNVQAGMLLQKYDDKLTTLWEKKFLIDWYNSEKDNVEGLHEKENGNLILLSSEIKRLDASSGPNGVPSRAHIRIVEVTPDGDIVVDKIINTGHYSRAMHGNTYDEKTGNLYLGYFVDTIINSNPIHQSGINENFMRDGLMALDSNYNILWKGALNDSSFWVRSKNTRGYQMILNLDSSLLLGIENKSHYIPQLVDDEYFDVPYYGYEIRNISKSNGKTLWAHQYAFLHPLLGGYFDYEVQDMIQTSDGGFMTVGTVYRHDSIVMGASFRNGFALKTNCLGYLEYQPLAGVEYTIDDSLAVHFHNTSAFAGSYEWHFGFNDSTFSCFEHNDEFSITYPDEGEYSVQLIAKGCPGYADTLSFNIRLKQPEDSVVKHGYTDLLTIGPNPVSSGGLLNLYIGDLPSESVRLTLVSLDGKTIHEFGAAKSASQQFAIMDVAAGQYLMLLQTDTEVLEMKKVVVR